MLCRARKSLQSEDRPPHPSASAIASSLAGGSGEAEPVTLRSRLEEASNSILQLPGGGSFMSRLGLVSASMTKHPAAAAAPVGASYDLCNCILSKKFRPDEYLFYSSPHRCLVHNLIVIMI